MARNNFNFQASLKLNSSEFKKGIKDVQRSLNGLKSSFLSFAGALGAGLGFTQLVSNLKDTATQLSVAKNTLENVSNVAKEYETSMGKVTVSVSNYNETLAYSKRLASEYSQDLIAVMTNFAQFHAACEKTNLGLEQQKDVFEALTKAAAYYHMDASRAKDMMNAMTQMMSKGKVAAEELRRQLGNSLPGAFNLMAAALGVTTQELDDMMRKGQVIASDALPKFAAMLNTVSENADFDSLQMSLNKLKNSWYELVDNSGAENFFNSIVQGTTNIVTSIDRNMGEIKSSILGLVVAIGSYKLFESWRKQGVAYIEDNVKQLKTLEKEYKAHLDKVNAMSKGTSAAALSIKFNPTTGAASIGNGIADTESLKAILKYNQTLVSIAKAKREAYGISVMSRGEIASIEAYNKGIIAALNNTKNVSIATKTWQVAVAGVKNVMKQIGTTLKGMGIMAIVSAILGVITKIVSNIKQAREETQRINNIVKEYEANSKRVDENVAASNAKLESQLRIVKDSEKSESARLLALKEINKTLGLVGDNQLKLDDLNTLEGEYDKITASVLRWCEATKIQAKIQYQASKNAEALARYEDAVAKKKEAEASLAKRAKIQATDEYGHAVGGEVFVNPIGAAKDLKNIKNAEAEMAQYQKIIDSTEAKLDELGVELSSFYEGPHKGDNIETDITKVYDKYIKEKKELTNKLKEHAITQEDFNKELDNLNKKYWEEAAGTGEYSIEDILKKVDKKKTLTAMEKWYKDLKDAAEEAAQRTLFDDMVEDALKEIEKAIAEEEKKFQDELEKSIEDDTKRLDLELDAATKMVPSRGKRNTLFDYDKKSSGILGEEMELSKRQAEAIKDMIQDLQEKYSDLGEKSELIEKILAKWKEDLKKASAEADNFEAAMNLAKVREDIEKLNKSIAETAYGGLKNLATSLDRCVKGAESIRDVMEDWDSTGWEKFMAVFNEIIQIADTIIGIMQTINTISELTKTLQNAELAQQIALNEELAKELALRLALKAAKGQELSETEKQIAANIAEAASSSVAASANAGEAVAGATASGAKIPFPYNLLAIAAGVAAVVGALAMMSKFANGGIVGGNSSNGDKNIIRANSGELILNKAQQGTLYNAIASGNLGGGGEWRVKGTDLIKVINNTKNKYHI